MFPTNSLKNTVFLLCAALSILFSINAYAEEDKAVAKVPDLNDVGGGSTPLPDLFTGAMSYRIPIEVPPGRNGIDPALALTYRSTNSNTWVGVGWDLEVGAIERSTRNGVDYNGDNFILRQSGSVTELIHFGDGNEYRAKIENGFLRIQKQSGGSGTYWVVTNKNGIRYYYGQASVTRQDYTDPNSSTTYEFKWCLDKVEDPNGNYMTLTYFKEQGQIYLDQINYTGNDYGSFTPTNYVKFYRESNPAANEIYSTHFKVKSAYRLKTIDIIANGNRVRTYKASYTGENSSL